MFQIRYGSESNKSFWFTLDEHMGEGEFLLKARDKRDCIISDEDEPVGVTNPFWDNIPLLTLVHLKIAKENRQ